MVKAIVGACWGDEGKGKITDVLAEDSDIVVRFQGGSNAGHTIINEYGKFALHQLPSGVFRQNITNIIGNGVALSVENFLKEVQSVVERGVPAPKLLVSDRCQVVMPYHKELDGMEEARLAAKSFGSTKSGIAPFYSDKYAKIGFQVSDLFDDKDSLMERIDHVLGLKNVLYTELYHQKPLEREEIYEKLESAAARKGVKADYICAGDLIQSGKLSLSCLYPYRDTLSSDRNGHSEVLLAEYGDFSMLLMGDLGTEGEAEIAEVWDEKKKVQILKAGHHGSSTSSSELFLDTVRPQIAVLSYGKDNSYGHPHPEVIERLEERGIASWATEEQGMITVRTDGKELEIQGFLKNR